MEAIHTKKIVIIGAGNVATHLGLCLLENDVAVSQVWSRTLSNARALADKLDCEAISDYELLDRKADYYIFSVKDDVLPHVVTEVCSRCKQGIFLHTAGSISMNVFQSHAKSFGVLYPMQTFSKLRVVDFKNIPCFVEASDKATLLSIRTLAQTLSNKVFNLDEAGRKVLHIAAVFACNFSNCCFALAEQLLEQHGMTFDVMLPLVDEMVAKVHSMPPIDAQTGPASRGDKNVMMSHRKMLSNTDRLLNVYVMMSDMIALMQQKNKTHDKL